MSDANLDSENKGKAAYERDLILRPTYHNGKKRAAWHELCETARWSWIRNPTAREESSATGETNS